MQMETIILASGSERRKEFFKLLGLPFTSMPPLVDESFDPSSSPRTVAEGLALRKAAKIAPMSDENAPWVCAADTIIALDGAIFGKPRDQDDARRMLAAFQGRSHEVISAVALYNGRAKSYDCRSIASLVSFAALSPGEIEWYLGTGEWKDAAGAYEIQGLASCFISSITGSYSSIVGLPLREFYAILRDNSYPYGG